MFDEELAHVGTEGSAGEAGSRGSIGWREAHRQLQRIARRRASLDADEARWLVVARDAGVHVELGFRSMVDYVAHTLGCQPRTAYERLRVAEALVDLPVIRAALAAGATSWCAVRELTRVAKPETEQAWLDRAAGKTMRDLERLVREHAPGDHPDDPGEPDLAPRTLRLELAPEMYALWLDTCRMLQDERGERLDDNAMVAALCGRMRAEPTATAATAPRHHLAVTVCERCDRAAIDADGQIVDIGTEALALARCDAVQVGRLDDPRAPSTVDIPKKIRRHVERRDHHRCVVPGCRASRGLHIHHLVPRSEGGDHEPSLLCLLCEAHHLALHAGRLRILGRAPDQLVFEHADGRPYGAPPPLVDPFADARHALRDLGFTPKQATVAVERARVHVGTTADLERVIRACLRECRDLSGL